MGLGTDSVKTKLQGNFVIPYVSPIFQQYGFLWLGDTLCKNNIDLEINMWASLGQIVKQFK